MGKRQIFKKKSYRKGLWEEKSALEKKIVRKQQTIGQIEGAMQSWSNRLQDDLAQEVAILKGQLKVVTDKLKELAKFEKTKGAGDKVRVGAVVNLEIEGEIGSYFLTGVQSDPEKGVLSRRSPIGKAVLGKRVGEEAIVKTPQGKRKVKILPFAPSHQ